MKTLADVTISIWLTCSTISCGMYLLKRNVTY